MGLIRPLFQTRTYRHVAYLALAFPLGVAYFVFLVVGIAVGLSLSVVWIGVPILLGMILAWRSLGTFERGLHRTLLQEDIAEPAVRFLGAGTLWQRTKRLLNDSGTWRTLGWLFLRFPAGIATFVLLVTWAAVAIALSLAFLYVNVDLFNEVIDRLAQSGINVEITPADVPDWVVDPIHAWWMTPLGVLLAIGWFHVVNGLAFLYRVSGVALLGPSLRERAVVAESRATEAETRTRLAHELHDGIGHAVTLMVVQAGAGRKVFESDPAFAKESLEVIERTGRRSLSELDRVLSILRDDSGAAIEPPAPDLSQLDSLVARVRDADIPITLTTRGPITEIPTSVQRSAYRIVQEALTNVMRHAQAPTEVTLDVTASSLEIEVRNLPPSQTPPRQSGTGRGVIGMRERVAAHSGSSQIGPTPDGGYRVRVSLPIHDR